MTAFADIFEQSRRRIFGLAYRMLGSAADAEDIVQETYLRAAKANAEDLRAPEAYFVTIATRLCLDQLKAARRQREIYVGAWLPEPIPDTEGLSPEGAAELADDLSFALLLTLETLSAPERAAFLMHDVFDVGYDAVADALGRSEAACRQLASRARKAVGAARRIKKPAAEAHQAILSRFVEALETGDASQLHALLAKDAVAYSDGGGVRPAALNPIVGADKVARFFLGLARKAQRLGHAPSFRLAEINGAPGLLAFVDGAFDQTISIETDGERIQALFMVRNPEKLKAFEDAAAYSCDP